MEFGEHEHYYIKLLRSLPLSCNAVHPPLKTIGITSCYTGEGVSTVAVRLAAVAAGTGMRVLLVDLNWQRPAIHRSFNVPASPGLSEALATYPGDDVPVQATHIANLSVLTSGRTNAHDNLFTSEGNLNDLIRTLRVDFDLILFDLPACEIAESNLTFVNVLDGVVLVVEAERVRWEVARRMKALLTRSGANLLGAVLNKRRQPIPGWLYRKL